ncbi:transcriptional repressor [Legionella fallonii]|uniref:transcriptional repressor n=1 Tax=Legionella fallonii TaxID=96230 RepID=UPI0038B27261
MLKSNTRHITAESLYLQLKAYGNNIGLATIYRTLSDFMEVGIVKRHYFLV